jgi:hypothetical protein
MSIRQNENADPFGSADESTILVELNGIEPMTS